MEQVGFIMPYGTRGHDVLRATEIVAPIQDPKFRERVVHTANRFLKYDMSSTARGDILDFFAKCNLELLSELDQYDEGKRDQLIKLIVPQSVREGDVKAVILDRVLGEAWDVK